MIRINENYQKLQASYLFAEIARRVNQHQKENPEKEFYPLKYAICPNMKKITLDKVLKSLEKLEPKIKLSDLIIHNAKKPLKRMMDISRGD